MFHCTDSSMRSKLLRVVNTSTRMINTTMAKPPPSLLAIVRFENMLVAPQGGPPRRAPHWSDPAMPGRLPTVRRMA